jgi:hypothetical protein
LEKLKQDKIKAEKDAENEVKELERKALRAAKKTAKKEELAEEVKVEEKTPVEFSIEEIYKELPKAKNLRETAQKNLINSNFDKIVEQLIKNDKIQKKC